MSDTHPIDGVLVAFSYGFVSGTKRDPVITKEVADSKHAGEDAGAWSNKLYPGSVCGARNSFTELRKHLGGIRAWHYNSTFMFEDELWRILPSKRVEAYKAFVEHDGKTRAFELLEIFINDLPNLIDLARLGRGEAFKITDYPTVDEVRSKFNYSVSYRPMPTSAGLNPVLFQEAIQQINELNARRLQESNAALIERFMKPFQTLSDQMANPGHRKLAPVLASIQEFCNLIPSLDLSNNQPLLALAADVKSRFESVTPDAIKQDEETAKMVARTATEVVAALQNFGQPGMRAFA